MNTKAFSAAIAVALALLATAASAAQAAPEFSAASYPTTVQGSDTQTFKFSEVGSVTCESASYSGTLSKQSTTLSLSPSYGECQSAGYPVTASAIACKYVYRPKTKTAEDNYKGNFDISCETGMSIEMSAFAEKGSSIVVCQLKILSPQTELTPISFVNINGGDEIEVIQKGEKVMYSQEGILCANGTFSKGTFESIEVLKGKNKGGEPVDMQIVGE